MKTTAFLWISMAILGTLGAGCAGSTSDSAEGAADLNKTATSKPAKSETFEFTCHSPDGDFLATLKVTTGATATFVATFDGDSTEYKATEDRAHKVEDVNFIRAAWDKDDPWQDSGTSYLLVSKIVLEGKVGDVKYEQPAPLSPKGTCTPKKPG
jgi:hypothetical protein